MSKFRPRAVVAWIPIGTLSFDGVQGPGNCSQGSLVTEVKDSVLTIQSFSWNAIA